MTNMTVTIARTTLSDGGFVAVYNQSGALVGVSEYLAPGGHENVTVTLSSPLEAPERDRERSRNGTGGQVRERNRTRTTTLLAITHRDTNGNLAFEYVSSNSVDDSPYVDAGPVSDDAIITVEAVRAGTGGEGEGRRGGGQRGHNGRRGS
ncbi:MULTISPECIES: DUF7282 domain-containing protein [Salinibaculum]|uniref:DUF7282 domain-containing protein n=1 Tax=Salinibaculum TaxID=2732368 RepID=UPI0030CD631A